MTLQIKRISPLMGAELVGFDAAAPYTPETVAALKQAFLEHHLLLIRGQEIAAEDEVRLSELFGPVSRMGEHMKHGGKTMNISNAHKDGALPTGELLFHSDQLFCKYPLKAIALYAVEVPSQGGDTLFANMYRAYETLSAPLQRFLEGLDALHAVANAGKTSYAKELAGKPGAMTGQQAVHPVVRVHPETDRKLLFVNEGFTAEILGLAPAESRALLDFLFEHSTRPERIYRHRWQLNDLVIWDNRAVLHYAVSDYKGIGWRYMHRTSVQGEACR